MVTVRIVIGGPSNSGKSTFAPILQEALNLVNIHTYHCDYDPFSPTRDYVLKKISNQERKKRKTTITEEESIQKAKEFCNVGSGYDLVIGDLPGTTDNITSILASGGTHAIILCSDQKANEKEKWVNFFKDISIPVIAILESNLTNDEEIRNGAIITGKLSNLVREDPPLSPSDTMIALAILIGEEI